MLNKTLKYILIGVAGALILGGLAALILSGKSEREAIKCTGLNVVVLDSLENDFISAKDVRLFLEKEYGEYLGVALDSIDLNKIEEILDGRRAVAKSEAYVTKDGLLNIEVTQRKPVVRFQKGGEGFYADAEGCVLPLQSSYASHVQIVDGDIPIDMKCGYKGQIDNPKQKEWFDKVMRVVNFINGNGTWKDRIVQIHVSDGGELTMIPREGTERFLFGQPVNIEDKFSRIEKYYSAIRPAKGDGHYKTISLEYDGQIVCR